LAHAIAVTLRDLCPALQNKTYFNQDALLLAQAQIVSGAMVLKEETRKL